MNDRKVMECRVAEALVASLAKPPSKAGMRLVGERELSRVFCVPRKLIRAVIASLIETGVLSKRHGSGTYVRRVPQFPRKNGAGEIEPRHLPPPEALFAKPPPTSQRRKPLRKSTRLHICHLGNEASTTLSRSAPTLWAGFRAAITEAGHQFTTLDFSVAGETHIAEHAEEIRLLLRKQKYDGYVVEDRDAKAFKLALGDGKMSAIFLGAEMEPESPLSALAPYSPLICIDFAGAAEGAVGLLAEAGYRRIALLGLSTKRHPAIHTKAYEMAMSERLLSYRNVRFCQPDFEDAEHAIDALFSRKDPPEALYVGDDILLGVAAPILQRRGIRPGQEIAVITLSSKGNPLPEGYEWSRMEFNMEGVGRIAASSLLREIQTAGTELCSFAHTATWIPGQTHHRKPEAP